MNTTPVHALTDIDGGIVVDPAPRLAGPPVFGGPGNAAFDLVPVRSTGRETLRFDFPGVSVGSAHYEEGPTGATVIHIPAGARTAVDARGGAVGLSGGYDFNHAICLAGGAAYGLEAGAGVKAQHDGIYRAKYVPQDSAEYLEKSKYGKSTTA